MKWVVVAAVWYMAGLLLFYYAADYSNQHWVSGFYIWDKTKDLLFVTAIMVNLKQFRKSFKTIFYFCIIRLVWEIVADITRVDINNSNVIDWIFLVFLILWLMAAIKELKAWRSAKW